MAKTLFDKIWDSHVITDLGNGFVLLHIDRLLLHDLSGARALQEAVEKGYAPAQPRLVYGTPDHAISTAPGRTEKTFPPGEPLIRNMRAATAKYGIRLFDLGQDGNGIVHIIGPELALTLPGTTLICGDSHTCTHGGMGALAFGVGSSELVHALATQTMVQRKPKRFRVHFEGKIPEGVTPKDMILHLIGDVGTAAGTGHAVEYAGSAIRSLPVEGRLTICNLSIEMGARTGMVAPDDITFDYLAGRDFAPKDAMWDRAVAHWRTLPSDPDAEFDREHTIDMSKVAPQITWGTSPEHVIAVDQADSRSDDGAGGEARGLDGGAAVSGPRARQADRGHQGRLGVHRLLHQQPHLRPARRRRRRQGPPQGRPRHGLDRAGLGAGEARGRGRGTRPRVPRRRLRMARARLLDVHRLQRRARAAGPAQRVDLQPQLRRPPGARRAHPSRQPGDGRGGGDQGRHRRRQEA